MTEYVHPFTSTWATADHRTSNVFFGQALGASGIILQAGILMGLVLLVIRRWGQTLAVGSFTLIFSLNATALSFFHDTYHLITAAAVAGATADLLLKLLKPSMERPVMFRLFAFLVPVILNLIYFFELIITEGIWWSVHMWTGTVLLAGFAGWLISFILMPPYIPSIIDPKN